jgi:hypothetical protein
MLILMVKKLILTLILSKKTSEIHSTSHVSISHVIKQIFPTS